MNEHKHASKRLVLRSLIGATDFICSAFDVRAAGAGRLRRHLCGSWTGVRSCARITASLVRGDRRCSGDVSPWHRWSVAGRLTGYPLLARGDVALSDFFLLYDLNVRPALPLLVMDSRAPGSEIEVGRGVLCR